MPLVLMLLLTQAHAGDPAVQQHLNEVVDTLRAETPAHLSADQQARRADLLNLLEGYAAAGDYPRHDGPYAAPQRRRAPPRAFRGPWRRAPVFVDSRGTHCAVGYLMGATDPELVDRIVAAENSAYVPEMRTPGIAAWAQHHGFTPAELAWIQPEYAHYPIPNCETFDPPEPHPWHATNDEGAELWVYGQACHTCGGALSVTIDVWNKGDTPSLASTLDLQLGAMSLHSDTLPEGERIARLSVPPLAPADAARVGSFSIEGSLNRMYNDELDLYAVPVHGTPLKQGRAFDTVWRPERGWQEMLYPYECDEVRDPEPDPAYDSGDEGHQEEWEEPDEDDDTGVPDEHPQPSAPSTPAAGCTSLAASPLGAPVALVLGLVLLGRRRVRDGHQHPPLA